MEAVRRAVRRELNATEVQTQSLLEEIAAMRNMTHEVRGKTTS